MNDNYSFALPLFALLLFLGGISFYTLVIYIDPANGNEIKLSRGMLFLIYVITTLLATLVYHRLFSMIIKKTPEPLHSNPLATLEYSKDQWIKFKKPEFLPRLNKFLITRVTAIIVVAVGFYIFTKRELLFCLIMLNTFIIGFVPVIFIVTKDFVLEVINNLFAKKYIVNIYSDGLTVNNWRFPFKYYIDQRNSMTLDRVKIIKELDIQFLQFETTKKFYGDSGDTEGIEFLKKRIKIPIMANQFVDAEQVIRKLS